MRRSLLALTFILVSTFSFCQKADIPCPCPHRNSISVTGEGVYETDPDVAVISLTISTQEKQLKDSRASRAADQIREVLRANGVDPKEAQIGFFQVAPVYDYGKTKRKTVAFGVQSKITLKLKDFSKVASLTDALGSIDVTGDQNVSYQVSDMATAKNKAIENATQVARRNAETVAATAGTKLGNLLSASIETRIEPIARLRAVSQTVEVMSTDRSYVPPAPTAQFGAGTVTVNAQVNLEFAIQ